MSDTARMFALIAAVLGLTVAIGPGSASLAVRGL
jgi:hypothetical protein